jgi:hypothetical protein
MEYLQYAGSAADGGGGSSSSSGSSAKSAGIIAYVPGVVGSGKVLIGTNHEWTTLNSYGSLSGVDELRWLDEAKTKPDIDAKSNQKVIKAKTVRQFVNGLDPTKYTEQYKLDMLDRLKSRYPGINLDDNLIQESKRLEVDLFDFVKAMMPESIVNSGIKDQYHLLNVKIGFELAPKGTKNVFPKGGILPEDGGDLLKTAKREFKEETGFDISAVPGLTFKPINPTAVEGQYLFYLVEITDAIAKQILETFEGTPEEPSPSSGGGGSKYIPLSLRPKKGGHRYYSELFDLKFTDKPTNLDKDYDEPILTKCISDGLIILELPAKYVPSSKKPGSSGVPKFSFGSGSSSGSWSRFGGGEIDYQQKFQKYQQKLLNN